MRYFHLHLVSDATGETLINVGRAVAAQYAETNAIEHIHSLVRTPDHVDRVVRGIEEAPGIVLYTLVDRGLASQLEEACRALPAPCVGVLDPVLAAFGAYLGRESAGRSGAQHVLDAEYFQRIDALNFTLAHDDGLATEDVEEADVVLVGISRTSKTPTSIYLANRGVKAMNVPFVLGQDVPRAVRDAKAPLVVGLIASAERIVAIRQNRVLGLKEDAPAEYIDPGTISEEITQSRRVCARHGWPIIDVTRRSIEETAAAVLALMAERR